MTLLVSILKKIAQKRGQILKYELISLNLTSRFRLSFSFDLNDRNAWLTADYLTSNKRPI